MQRRATETTEAIYARRVVVHSAIQALIMSDGHARGRLRPEVLAPISAGSTTFLFWRLRDDTMSVLHMFLPVSEPARSETLAQLIKTHHIPRHLVRGIALENRGEREAAVPVGALQSQQQVQSPEPQAPAALE
jgi:hypothetical protein